MSDEAPGEARRAGLRTVRMEAFSDGVFAIAITLLPSASGWCGPTSPMPSWRR